MASAEGASLGNFKGVMLCNRPGEAPLDKKKSGSGPPTFKWVTSHEPVGLCPAKKVTVAESCPPGSLPAMAAHKKFLRELAAQVRDTKQYLALEATEEEARHRKIKAKGDAQREAVRAMMADYWTERGVTLRKQPKRDEAAGAEPVQPERSRLMEALQLSGPRKHGRGVGAARQEEDASKRPLWAMTAQQVEAAEEENADSLIQFASSLDFEEYVHDLEFKSALSFLATRARQLQKEEEEWQQQLLDDLNAAEEQPAEEANPQEGALEQELLTNGKHNGHVLNGEAPAAGLEDRPAWNGSPEGEGDAKAEADRVLHTSQQMRNVHSNASVRALIGRTKAEKAVAKREDVTDTLKADKYVPPLIVTSEEGSELRGRAKQILPSNMPYLYRNPAV
ncbi:unnamed protein product [Vitrella brassicaformis CCMP3155]|uniref:Uncharacterized protein n=2 Tax=Vitrella brassicaformis TaxID=1169539 RepID=A0A0G4GKI4_VITBC|nr:unnamed protein product [Vitrella brassicaformis CCMP3155]|mmetsp:Transcript_40115/g.100407  ORF Transcript_40115/g.100407 Transcript_40115/m.100407 type:complete len:393 (+) Transcript_40115:138-1316(+)|eukprot:CEM30545.1 unnamed protein product [Vitrella brassicaformis CCMP3155]